ncbi:MAG: cytidylate kinase-like family protein [Clostridiales bacterium]|nr:cytidylate kinase-like family protein [Clostridiales bacterium]
MPVITISRQMGSLGDEVASALSRKLSWECITRDLLMERFFPDSSADQRNRLAESARFYLSEYKDGKSFRDVLSESLEEMARTESAILLGFGSQLLFSGNENAIHVRIIAPDEIRLSRIRKQFHLTEEAAQALLSGTDRKHKRFVSHVFSADSTDETLYHLILNTGYMSVDECVAAILATLHEHELRVRITSETKKEGSSDHQTTTPVFKNPSEEEFAKILDMYHIEWKYEPKTFPVEWDSEGNITLAFSPDFYLPRFDTYLELTTMNQKYVTKKNRKLKKVKELYPGTNIKIVYKKDFLELAERLRGFGAPESAQEPDSSTTE